METIPLRPLFENRQFQEASNPVQLAIIKVVYQLCIRRILDTEYSQVIRRYAETNDVTYYNNKNVIISVLQTVMPQIAKIKRLKNKASANGNKANAQKAIKHRLERQGKQTFFDNIDMHVEVTPIRPDTPKHTYNLGRHDHIARIKAEKGNATGETRLFTDN